MSNQVQGKIEKAYLNPKGYASVLCNGNWYSTGKTLLKEYEGQVVTFDAEAVQKGEKTYYNMVAKSIKGQSAPQAAASAPATTKYNSNDDRQVLIMRQSSYKTGTDIAAAALAGGALQMPTKKAAQFDAFLGYVDAAAAHVYNGVVDGACFTSEEEAQFEENPEPEGWKPTEA